MKEADEFESNWYKGPTREMPPATFPIADYLLHASWQLLMVIVIAALAYLAVGCVHAPTYPAAPRDRAHREAALVKLEVRCGDLPAGGELVAASGRALYGVMVGPRHALTAWHGVACADIPRVVATLSDGHRVFMAVEKEWPDDDVARLVVATAEWFEIAPPTVAPPKHGEVELRTTVKGDSGSPVYDFDGNLVGIITNVAFANGKDIAAYVGGSRTWRAAKFVTLYNRQVMP